MKLKPMSLRPLRGSKGGKSESDDDNLFSTDVVEALVGISEGPIKGLAEGGAKNFFVGDTPLLDASGKSNFKSFELIVRKGKAEGEDIHSRMGGFGSTTQVGVELSQNTPVIRSGTYTDIDYLDIRLAISRLGKVDEKGAFEHTGKVKVEYRRSDQSTWTPIRSRDLDPPAAEIPLANGTAYTAAVNSLTKTMGAVYDRFAGAGDTAPAVPSSATSPYWFHSSQQYRPYYLNEGNWVQVADATRNGNVWTWPGNNKATYGTKPPSTGRVIGHFWINTATAMPHIWNGSIWIQAGSTFAPGAGSTGTSITVTNGEIKIVGKTQTTFVKEFRIPVRSWASHTYDIRVTKTSADSTDETYFDVTWESFAEITADVYNFPSLATYQLTARASEQFSSIPEFSGVWEGRIIRVPSNYNPTTRTYSGVWDGTWKLEYSNNPAFVGYDLVMNATYGMNAYYPVTLNKWDVYEAGRWCDTLTADGSPRFTFNGVIDTARSGREAIDYVFGIFGGRFFDDGNGTGVIRIDNDSSAVAIFAPENVEGGLFTYSQTPLGSRHNDITVTFINPDQNWQEDRRRVVDQDHIDTFGRNATNIVAVGCTSKREAIRHGRYALATGLTEKTIVTFNTNRAGAFIQPYDVILIADDQNEYGIHGRVKSVVNSTTIALRDPIYLEVGVSYQISFTGIDYIDGEYTVVTSAIAGGQSGTLSEITVTGSLPGDVAADTVFAITQVGTEFSPKPFRVTDIEVSDSEESVKVTAIEINRLKWDYVDGIINNLDYDGFVDLELSTIPQPITEASVTPSTAEKNGQLIRNLLIEWKPSPSTFVVKYRLSVSVNNGPFVLLSEVTGLRYEYADVALANYVFVVEPMGKNGLIGQPIYFEHQMLAAAGASPDIENLALQNTGYTQNDGTYVAQITATWDAVIGEPITHYEVQWKATADSTFQTVAARSAIYQLAPLTVNNEYTVRVRALADGDVVRDWATATLTASGDTVAPPTPTNWGGDRGFDFITLSGDRSPAEDFKAFRIYGSTAASTNLTLLAEVASNFFLRRPPVGDDITRYKVSAIDFVGNESDKTPYISVVPLTYNVAPVPNIPTGLALSSALTNASLARLTATWNANAESNTVYEVAIRPVGGSMVAFQTSQTRHEWDVMPGTEYVVAVRAMNVYGQYSSFSAEVSHTATADTVPPATPTGLTATGAFEGIWLEWNPNTEIDLARYEIAMQTQPTPAPANQGTTYSFSTAATAMHIALSDSGIRSFFIRAVDTSGNRSDWSTVVTAQTINVTAADIDTRGLGLRDALGNDILTGTGELSPAVFVTVNGSQISLSQIAANGLVPSINFVGTFDHAPTEGELGASWKQNAVYKNSVDGKSYILTGNPLAWQVYLEDGQLYSVSIESTNGTIFRVGQSQSTTLKARVFKNGAEITAQVPDNWFRWRRVSIIPQDPPNDDATFNGFYQTGYKEVLVSVDSVLARATFFCDIISQ